MDMDPEAVEEDHVGALFLDCNQTFAEAEAESVAETVHAQPDGDLLSLDISMEEERSRQHPTTKLKPKTSVTCIANPAAASGESVSVSVIEQQQQQPGKKGRKRGSYNCGKCGLPKKGHICSGTQQNPDDAIAEPQTQIHAQEQQITSTPAKCVGRTPPASPATPFHYLLQPQVQSVSRSCSSSVDRPRLNGVKRSLAMLEATPGRRGLNNSQERSIETLSDECILEILRRLSPTSLWEAGKVCSQWRKFTNYVWSSVIQSQLIVSPELRGRTVGVLQKCSNIKHLSLNIESVIDDLFLGTVTRTVPFLVSLEIQCTLNSLNQVTGEGLNSSITLCKYLRVLKMDNCRQIRCFDLYSTQLSTLWLHDCHSITDMVLNCSSLSELSLTFLEEDEITDLSHIIENLGKTCSRLSRIHIASSRISHAEVLALAGANMRLLSMVSLIYGFKVTDASMVALASSYSYLQMLDLSGSAITDEGLKIICTAYKETLTRLLIPLCPYISAEGLQVVSDLPYLQLLDCGMTIKASEENLKSLEGTIKNQVVINHQRIRKLSFWGCSGIQGLFLDCPELVDLNLNCCSNLSPENTMLSCPSLQSVHYDSCRDDLKQTLFEKVLANTMHQHTNRQNSGLSQKRMADASKRVVAPYCGLIEGQHMEDTGKHGTF